MRYFVGPAATPLSGRVSQANLEQARPQIYAIPTQFVNFIIYSAGLRVRLTVSGFAR